MAVYRKSGLTVSLFTLEATEFIGDIIDVTVSIEVHDEEASGIGDDWDFAWAVGRNITMEVNAFTGGTSQALSKAHLLALAGTSVAAVYTSGANTYAAQMLVGSGSHSSAKRSLQKQKVTLKGQGVATITAPT